MPLALTYGNVSYVSVGYDELVTPVETVELHGHTVGYSVNPGQGTPLLLVHGVGSNMHTWGALSHALVAAGQPYVAVDLLGHGSSGPGNGDFSLGANAARLRDLLDHLGIDSAHLVGHSLGGGISMQFLYQFPDRTASLTLISSGGLGTEVSMGLRAAALPGAKTVMQVITAPLVVRILRNATGALESMGMHNADFDSHTVAKFERLQAPDRLDSFLATVRSVVGPAGQRVSAVELVSAVTDPTAVLIIWGENDPMVPSDHGVDAHALLPGSSLVMIPGTGHHPHVDAVQVVATALLSHVAAHPARGAVLADA